MEIKCVVVGSMEVNCYILSNGSSCCIIDPGDDCEKILAATEGNFVEKIILTHGHFDHMNGAAKLCEMTGAKVYISENDSEMLDNAEKCLFSIFTGSSNGYNPVSSYVHLSSEVEICGETFNVIRTPGHSEGSVCLLFENMLISGDTLFCKTVGNYTFGDYNKLMTSLIKLMDLDDSIIVYPGHGPQTTIGQERKFNPFMRYL